MSDFTTPVTYHARSLDRHVCAPIGIISPDCPITYPPYYFHLITGFLFGSGVTLEIIHHNLLSSSPLPPVKAYFQSMLSACSCCLTYTTIFTLFFLDSLNVTLGETNQFLPLCLPRSFLPIECDTEKGSILWLKGANPSV